MYLKTQGIDLRAPFIEALNELNDDRIIIITCDVGFSFLEKFKGRVLNFGVTEQSSMIIAAALALEGFRPVFYSMIPFVTFRVHEMIRNAVCMHKAPVVIAGVKGSEKYSFLGFSHNLLWDTEETEWLEKLPGMKTYVPKTEEEVRQIVEEEYQRNGAAYIRL